CTGVRTTRGSTFVLRDGRGASQGCGAVLRQVKTLTNLNPWRSPVTSVPDVRVRPQAAHEHHRFVRLGWLALIAAFAATVACSHAKPAKEAMPTARNGSAATLSPGDVVDLKFFYVPELNDSQTIRPDGKLSLQLVGEVQAAGQTP